MIVRDYSPYKENKTGKDNNILLNANTKKQYNEALAFCKKYFNASFPSENIVNYTFDRFRSHFHGNAKLLLNCRYNDIIGSYELLITTKTIEKSYKWIKHDFIGNLTEYALIGNYK